MKIYIILLVTTFLFTSCSQESQYSITEIYGNGHKKAIELTEGGQLIKKVYYSENGVEKSVEIYDQNRLVNRWISGKIFVLSEVFTEYFGNGSLKKSGYYVDGKMNGNWSYYNRHDHLETERYFFNDKPTGIWVSYDEYKQVQKMENYGNIRSNGQFIEYYLSGQVKEASFYNNGNLDGMYVRYHENGEVKTSGQYSQNHKESL